MSNFKSQKILESTEIFDFEGLIQYIFDEHKLNKKVSGKNYIIYIN